jgi:hypothetical protein
MNAGLASFLGGFLPGSFFTGPQYALSAFHLDFKACSAANQRVALTTRVGIVTSGFDVKSTQQTNILPRGTMVACAIG